MNCLSVHILLNPYIPSSDVAQPAPLGVEINGDELPNEYVSLSLSSPVLQSDEMLQSPVNG